MGTAEDYYRDNRGHCVQASGLVLVVEQASLQVAAFAAHSIVHSLRPHDVRLSGNGGCCHVEIKLTPVLRPGRCAWQVKGCSRGACIELLGASDASSIVGKQLTELFVDVSCIQVWFHLLLSAASAWHAAPTAGVNDGLATANEPDH